MAYETLATIYDLLMGEIDYTAWAEDLNTRLHKWHCPGVRLLDLGCGTGNITLPLAQKGYQITGIDLSNEMLEQARKKSKERGLSVEWRQGDLCTPGKLWEDLGEVEFDAVIATFDTLNYIIDPEDLQYVLQEISFLLKDNGIFIFDVQTPYKLREYLGNNIYTLHHPEVDYIWENHFDTENEICQMDITFFLRQSNGLYRRVTECHQEKLYSPELLQIWLHLYGFEVLSVSEELGETPLTETSHRAVLVARRKAWEETLE